MIGRTLMDNAMHNQTSALLVGLSLVGLSLTACSHAAVNRGYSPDPNVITFTEARSTAASTALDLIRKLRPNFLRSRGRANFVQSTVSYPTVYVDGMRYGPITSLSQIPANWIAEVRLYRTWVPSRFGSDNLSGVLAITTRLHR